MIKISNTFFELKNSIYHSPTLDDSHKNFEKIYLEVREKEKRILNVEEIRKLPHVPKDSPDALLWRTRRKNINRFLKHLAHKKRACNILDIGCGNGFFTKLMQEQGHFVVGIDVNLLEVNQAVTAFGAEEIIWVYGDILCDPLPEATFDIITFCCSFQYFENTELLLRRCKQFLKPGGEIHIIDSPFYNEIGKAAAKARSKEYFEKVDVLPMQDYYFHHSYETLQNFIIQFNYKPNLFRTKLLHDSPFPWIVLK